MCLHQETSQTPSVLISRTTNASVFIIKADISLMGTTNRVNIAIFIYLFLQREILRGNNTFTIFILV